MKCYLKVLINAKHAILWAYGRRPLFSSKFSTFSLQRLITIKIDRSVLDFSLHTDLLPLTLAFLMVINFFNGTLMTKYLGYEFAENYYLGFNELTDYF